MKKETPNFSYWMDIDKQNELLSLRRSLVEAHAQYIDALAKFQTTNDSKEISLLKDVVAKYNLIIDRIEAARPCHAKIPDLKT